MSSPYPDTIEDLIERCNRLTNKYDLYKLGECKQHRDSPDGTEDLSGELVYGCAMIPAQWVLHVARTSLDMLKELYDAYETIDYEFGNVGDECASRKSNATEYILCLRKTIEALEVDG